MIPGLTSKGIEAFYFEGRVMVAKDGNYMPITESIELLTIFREEMEKDPQVEIALKILGITDPVKQIIEFVKCRFGRFDLRADINENGISYPEYWNCDKRGNCPVEGVLCLLPSGKNGRLTPRECEVIKLVAHDLADKQIADRLGISINTVQKHRTNIEHKIGCASKCGIVAFAYENNIL